MFLRYTIDIISLNSGCLGYPAPSLHPPPSGPHEILVLNWILYNLKEDCTSQIEIKVL